jgi:hypothetical protein
MLTWFKKVVFTCNHCAAEQRIPLRRVHFFERFHDLRSGQPVLIRCPRCHQGLQIPSDYTNWVGLPIQVDPDTLPTEAFIHDTIC